MLRTRVGFLATRLPQHTVFFDFSCALTMTGVIAPSKRFDTTNVLSCTTDSRDTHRTSFRTFSYDQLHELYIVAL